MWPKVTLLLFLSLQLVFVTSATNFTFEKVDSVQDSSRFLFKGKTSFYRGSDCSDLQPSYSKLLSEHRIFSIKRYPYLNFLLYKKLSVNTLEKEKRSERKFEFSDFLFSIVKNFLSFCSVQKIEFL